MGIGIINLGKLFSKFYRRHHDTGLKTLLLQVLSEPRFYGDLVYKFRDIRGKPEFSYNFSTIVTCYKQKGYNIHVIKQSANFAVNRMTLDNLA